MSEEPRSREARALAETALVRLLHELGEDDIPLIVLGGLVPEVLTADGNPGVPEHLGTTDVDVLLIAQVDPERELGAVERALERLPFEPDASADGWRWRGMIDGSPVRIEFLCDLDGYRESESIRPNGCARLAAANLRGTGYVACDFEWVALDGRLADGSSATVQARFAGLSGYLLAKCVAVRTRAAEKDYYDLAYVLLHNRAGGPEQAARRIRAGELADALTLLRSTFIEIRERFRRTSDPGPVGYAAQAGQVELGTPEAELRADAVDAVQRFLDALRV